MRILITLPIVIIQTITASDSSSSTKIEVIGAGLGRTGTLSLKAALETLGYRSYHYVGDVRHAKAWADLAAASGRSSSSNDTEKASMIDGIIDTIVADGYTATMDNPAADIYMHLFQRYPDAKVVLTVRDSPRAFASSWKTLYRSIEATERDFSLAFPTFFQWIPLFRNLKELRCFIGTTHLELPPCELLKHWDRHDEGWLEEQYEKHNRHVKNTIREDQLLVFNVKEGWGPLCQFLDKPVPNADTTPFPHVKVNSSIALQELRKTFTILVYIWIPLLVTTVASIYFCCSSRRRRRLRTGRHEGAKREKNE